MPPRFNEAHASVDFAALGVHFYVAKRDRGSGEREVLTVNGTTRKHTPGEAITPSFTLEQEAAQALFEELWRQGFRSVHDTGHSDRLDAARKEHIEDLRKVAKIG
jgi:hypothetical protein